MAIRQQYHIAESDNLEKMKRTLQWVYEQVAGCSGRTINEYF